jgi:dTDP-4-dehydrorhamnose reductase
VLVTGAGGQLGLDLLDRFAERGVVGLTRSELDITDEAAVVTALRDLAPRLVINAAAWTDVDACERDPHRAHAVHALGPWYLARACAWLGATLVTISTDHVFGGATPLDADGRARPLSEFDPVAPLNAYGRSKVAGEQLVRETLPSHHVVRTSWLCGARGENFVRSVLRRGRESGEVSVVDDQRGCPTFTRDLAAAIDELVASGRYGTVHRTNTGICSRFELAEAAVELAGADVVVHRRSTTDAPGEAPRPAWSALDPMHAVASGLAALPSWRDGLARLLDELAGSAEGRGAPGGAG